jgi:hypothetical protein
VVHGRGHTSFPAVSQTERGRPPERSSILFDNPLMVGSCSLPTVPESVEDELPGSLPQAIRIELRRTFRPPFDVPIVVAVNGAMMSSAWFFLPVTLKDKLFSLHGSLVFGLVLAGWMYSDVPATNVLGPDSTRAMAAITDPPMFRRLLYAKNLTLWILIAPLCSAITIGIGIAKHDLVAALCALAAIALVPLGALGIAAWVGIRFPYHPMPLRFRWEHHRPWWRMIVRWLSLAVTPYVLVPFLTAALLAPSLVLWGEFTTHGFSEKIPDADWAWGIAVACAIAAVCWIGGHRLGYRLARRRMVELFDFLGDPGRG